MKVKDLSMQLTRLNPVFDSAKTKEDGKSCRDVFVESRSGLKRLARIDETKENTYRTDFNGFKTLTKDCQEQLVSILDTYCGTPVEVRLNKRS